MSANTLKAIAVTAELTGTELSAAALRVMDSDLSCHPEPAVLRALDRCRKELKGRLTLAAVLDRVEESDGRPSADEAWSIALASDDEDETVVWTEEMAQAFWVAKPVLDARDKVGARMAFRDAYERMVREAREAAVPCRWSVSIGHDATRRAVALQAAVTLKRIAPDVAAKFFPVAMGNSPMAAALLGNRPQALLEVKGLTEEEMASRRRWFDSMRERAASLYRDMQEHDRRRAEDDRRRRDEANQRKADMMVRVDALLEARGEAAE